MEEEEFIRNFLNQQMERIQVPFIQRRLENGVLDDSEQLEEIKDLILQICNSEDQIKTLVELTQLILEKYNKLADEKSEQVSQLEHIIQSNETEMEFMKQSLIQYQKLYHEQQDKNQELQHILQQVEDKNEKSYKNEVNLEKQLQQLKDNLKKLDKQNNSKEIQKEREYQLQLVIQKLRKENEDQTKNNQIMKEDNNKLLHQFHDISHKYETLQKNSKQITNELEEQNKESQKIISDLEQTIDKYKEDIDKLNSQYAQISDSKKFQNDLNENYLNQIFHRQKSQQQFPTTSPFTTRKTQITPPQTLYKQLSQDDIHQKSKLKTKLSQYCQNNNLNSSQDQSPPLKIQNVESEIQKELNKLKDIQDLRQSKEDEDFKNLHIKDVDSSPTFDSLYSELQGGNNFSFTGAIENQNQQQPSPKFQSNQEDDINSQMHKYLLHKGNFEIQDNSNKSNDENNKQSKSPKKSNKSPHKQYHIKIKSPLEEFFELTIKSAKLNSPYMDDVLDIDTTGWMQGVQELALPFYKWYDHVFKKLHQIRNDLVKQKEETNVFFRNTIIY